MVGVTKDNFVFHSDFGGQQVPLDCQKAVVIPKLGSDVIFGEPGKRYNSVGTSARDRSIFVRYGGRSHYKRYIDAPRSSYGLARISRTCTVFGSGRLGLAVLQSLYEEKIFLLTPRQSGPDWFNPGIYQQYRGELELFNKTELPVQLS